MIIFETLSIAITYLLGYLKQHAKDCYEESAKPRKIKILVLFIGIESTLLGSVVSMFQTI